MDVFSVRSDPRLYNEKLTITEFIWKTEYLKRMVD
jgi:hypothetical protein